MVARFNIFRSYVNCSAAEMVVEEVRINTSLFASLLSGTGEDVHDWGVGTLLGSNMYSG